MNNWTKQKQVNSNQEKLQQYEENFTVLQKNLQDKTARTEGMARETCLVS